MTDDETPDFEVVEAKIIRFPGSYDPPAYAGPDSISPIEHDPLREIEKSIPPDAQLVTVKDVQRILSIGRSKAFQLMSRGALERRYIDGCSRITMKSVMAFVDGE